VSLERLLERKRLLEIETADARLYAIEGSPPT
jgi:hypothetical protein